MSLPASSRAQRRLDFVAGIGALVGLLWAMTQGVMTVTLIEVKCEVEHPETVLAVVAVGTALAAVAAVALATARRPRGALAAVGAELVPTLCWWLLVASTGEGCNYG